MVFVRIWSCLDHRSGFQRVRTFTGPSCRFKLGADLLLQTAVGSELEVRFNAVPAAAGRKAAAAGSEQTVIIELPAEGSDPDV